MDTKKKIAKKKTAAKVGKTKTLARKPASKAASPIDSLGCKVQEYKGTPTLVLSPDSRFPWSFGPAKARLIVEKIDAIRQFAEDNPAT